MREDGLQNGLKLRVFVNKWILGGWVYIFEALSNFLPPLDGFRARSSGRITEGPGCQGHSALLTDQRAPPVRDSDCLGHRERKSTAPCFVFLCTPPCSKERKAYAEYKLRFKTPTQYSPFIDDPTTISSAHPQTCMVLFPFSSLMLPTTFWPHSSTSQGRSII